MTDHDDISAIHYRGAALAYVRDKNAEISDQLFHCHFSTINLHQILHYIPINIETTVIERKSIWEALSCSPELFIRQKNTQFPFRYYYIKFIMESPNFKNVGLDFLDGGEGEGEEIQLTLTELTTDYWKDYQRYVTSLFDLSQTPLHFPLYDGESIKERVQNLYNSLGEAILNGDEELADQYRNQMEQLRMSSPTRSSVRHDLLNLIKIASIGQIFPNKKELIINYLDRIAACADGDFKKVNRLGIILSHLAHESWESRTNETS